MQLRLLLLVFLFLLATAAGAQDSGKPEKNPPPPHSAPQESPDESSSKQPRIDLFPPSENEDVIEMRPYDPHRAEKNIEVGDFYFKRKSYYAAMSRYCEALQWKPNDAVATFRLAEALNRSGDLAGARDNYRGYLKILPEGPLAAAARKALERISTLPEQPAKHLAEKQGCVVTGAGRRKVEELPLAPTTRAGPTSPPSQNPR